jgi:ADP-ribose pyrophosphatase YjhB (NUDIX family)
VSERRIRAIALAVIRRADELLVFEANDPVKGERFARPFGGGIEFGERGADALRREFREELAAELCDIRLLGACEDIFEYLGEPYHEIAFVYETAFADPALYTSERFAVTDVGDPDIPGVWRSPAALAARGVSLYPEELRNLLGT